MQRWAGDSRLGQGGEAEPGGEAGPGSPVAHARTIDTTPPPRLLRLRSARPAPPSCGALGTMADPRVRQIKIKTGVVKR